MAMGILSWIIMGLLVGIVAKLLMGGSGSSSWIMTIILGIAGAFVGGFIAKFLGFGDFSGFNLYSFIIATIGAIILLIGYRMLKK